MSKLLGWWGSEPRWVLVYAAVALLLAVSFGAVIVITGGH